MHTVGVNKSSARKKVIAIKAYVKKDFTQPEAVAPQGARKKNKGSPKLADRIRLEHK